MKVLILWCLIPVLFPVILANPWGGACVQFYNTRMDLSLVGSSSTHDADRRHLSLSRGTGDFWVVTKDEKYEHHYKITHKTRGEVLFESEQDFNGKYIFTWIKKTLINDGGASWNIVPVGNGNHHIKNQKFGHCLKPTGNEGWLTADAACNGPFYEWKVNKIAC